MKTDITIAEIAHGDIMQMRFRQSSKNHMIQQSDQAILKENGCVVVTHEEIEKYIKDHEDEYQAVKSVFSNILKNSNNLAIFKHSEYFIVCDISRIIDIEKALNTPEVYKIFLDSDIVFRIIPQDYQWFPKFVESLEAINRYDLLLKI